MVSMALNECNMIFFYYEQKTVPEKGQEISECKGGEKKHQWEGRKLWKTEKKVGEKANSFKRSELYHLSLCGGWKLREHRILQSLVSNVVAMKDDEGKRKVDKSWSTQMIELV